VRGYFRFNFKKARQRLGFQGFKSSKTARFAHSESKSVKWIAKKYIETAAANVKIINPNISLQISDELYFLRAGITSQRALKNNRGRNY
jgi:hypothetical protein